MSAEHHNEFISRTVRGVGAELIAQGTFEQQLVALESLVAGLFTTVIAADPKQRDADAYLSALMHAVRGRVRELARRLTEPQLRDALAARRKPGFRYPPERW